MITSDKQIKDPLKRLQSNNHNSFEYLASVFLWQESINPKILLSLYILGRLQLLGILIWSQYYYTTLPAKQDSLTHFFELLTQKIVDSETIMGNSTFTSFGARIKVISFYGLGLIFLTGILIWGQKTKRNFPKLEQFYCLLGSFHNEIVYWYINITCLKGLVNSSFDYDFFSVRVNNKSIANFVLISIILLINLLFCTLSLIFRFDPFKTSNLMSCWRPSCQIHTGLLKTFQTIILACLPKTFLSALAFWAVNIVIISLNHYELYKRFPFYHVSGMKISIIFNTINLVLIYPSAGSSIIFGLNNTNEMNLVYIELFALVLGIKASLGVFQQMLYNVLNNLTHGALKEAEVFKTMQLLDQILDSAKLSINSHSKFDSIDETYLFSILKIHQKECEKKSCACRIILYGNNDYFSLNDLKVEINNISHDLIYDFFKTSAKTLKSHRINIYLSYIEFLRQNSGRIALITLFNIPRKEISLVLRIGLDKLIHKLKLTLHNHYNHNIKYLNLCEYFEYQQTSSSMLECISEASHMFIDFWSLFNQNKLNSQKIYKQSKEFEFKADQIEQQWNLLSSRHPDHSRAFAYDYAKFLLTYRNSQSRAELYLKQYRDWIFKRQPILRGEGFTDKNFIDPNNITIYVTMKKERIGCVVDTSSNIDVFGYHKSELIGKNINSLIPTCIQQNHHNSLYKHLEHNPKHDRLFNSIISFARNKGGDLVQTQIYLAISPFFKDELIYMSLCRVLKTDSDYLIINSKGLLDSCSYKFQSKFNLTPYPGMPLSEIFEDETQFEEFMHNSLNQRGPMTSHRFQVFPKNYDVEEVEEIFLAKIGIVKVLGTHFFLIDIMYEKLIKTKVNLDLIPYYDPVELDDVEYAEAHETITTVHVKKVIQNEAKRKRLTLYHPTIKMRTVKLEDFMSVSTLDKEYGEARKDEKIDKLKNTMKKTAIVEKSERVKSAQAQMEKLLFEVPYLRPIVLLKFGFVIYGLLSLIMLIVYCESYIKESSKIGKTVDFALYFERAATEINSNFFYFNQLELANQNIFTKKRYSETENNENHLRKRIEAQLFDVIETHQTYLSYVTFPNPSLIPENYLLIENLDSTRSLTLEEFSKLWISAFNRVLRTSSKEEEFNLEDSKLILSHDLDFLKITLKIIKELLVHQAEIGNQDSTHLLDSFLAISVVLGLAFIGVYLYLEILFQTQQKSLYESLNKVELKQLEDYFHDLDINKSDLSLIKTLSTNYENKVKANIKRRTIEYKTTGSLKHFSIAFISILIFILQFVILEFLNNNKQASDPLNIGIHQLFTVVSLDLLFQRMTPTLMGNLFNSTMTSLTSEEKAREYDKTFNQILSLQDSLSFMLNSIDTGSSLQNIISGDLCEVINIRSLCEKNLLNIKNGLYGFNSQLINYQMDLNDLSKKKDFSLSYKKYIVETHSFIMYETILMDYFNQIYQGVIKSFMVDLYTKLDERQHSMKSFWVVYSFVLVITISITKALVLIPMVKEREDKKKMLRMVPIKIILSNHCLKTYLKNYTKEGYEYLFK